MLTLHKDSHLDHGLTDAQVKHLLTTFADRDGFFIETIELPEELGRVSCGLYGPVMGDAPIVEGAPTSDDRFGSDIITTVRMQRGAREWTSRMMPGAFRPRMVSTVTIIAGPHDGQSCVLFTAFGGPPAPQEPDDPGCKDLIKSVSFWNEHALAVGA